MKVNLFGNGFIGREFGKIEPEVVVNDRNDLFPKSNKIIYFISTIDNYNVFSNPFLDIETNLTLLVRVLENCRLMYGKEFEFNFISSWFVYGKVACPAREDSPCNPTGFYSITKRAAEQLLMSYCETHDIRYRILRMPNVLGVSDTKVSKKKNALQYMIRELAEGRGVSLYKGNILRDYMDVRDVAKAIHLILEKGDLDSIYNVGNGFGWSIGELLGVAVGAMENPGKISEMEVPAFHKNVQVEQMYMDIDKLESLGFVPDHGVQDTVSEIARYYESQFRHPDLQ